MQLICSISAEMKEKKKTVKEKSDGINGLNYAMRETESMKETTIVINSNSNLESVIKQDF